MKYTYNAVVTGVHDGDTVTMKIDLGLDVFLHNQKMRLYGINTPEVVGINKAEGLRAKEFVVTLVLEMNVIAVTHKDKRDKYGRYLVEIFLIGDNESVNKKLLRHNLAVPYLP